MKQDIFSSILRGKYKEVKKDNVVVKSCIINHCYDPSIIDEELEENNTKVLFSLD